MHRTIFAAAFVLLLLLGSPALPEEPSGPEIGFPAIKEYLDTGKRSPGLIEELKQIREKSKSTPEYKALDGLMNRAGLKGRFQFIEFLEREGLIGRASPEVLPAIGRVRIHSVEVVDRRPETDVFFPGRAPPSRQELKVGFGIEGDLFSYLKYHEHNLGVEFCVCIPGAYGGNHDKNLDHDPYVYDDDGIVNSYRKDIAEGARQTPDRIFRVYAYMQGKEERRRGYRCRHFPRLRLVARAEEPMSAAYKRQHGGRQPHDRVDAHQRENHLGGDSAGAPAVTAAARPSSAF